MKSRNLIAAVQVLSILGSNLCFGITEEQAVNRIARAWKQSKSHAILHDLQSSDPNTQSEALRKLWNFQNENVAFANFLSKSPQTQESIARLVYHPDHTTKALVSRVLNSFRITDDKVIRDLVDAANDSDPNTRSIAAHILAGDMEVFSGGADPQSDETKQLVSSLVGHTDSGVSYALMQKELKSKETSPEVMNEILARIAEAPNGDIQMALLTLGVSECDVMNTIMANPHLLAEIGPGAHQPFYQAPTMDLSSTDLDGLIHALSSDEIEKRSSAAAQLGAQIRSGTLSDSDRERVTLALVKSLEVFYDKNARSYSYPTNAQESALQALSFLSPQYAIDDTSRAKLIDLLSNSESQDTRMLISERVVMALKVTTPDMVEALVDRVENDKSSYVRANSLMSLSQTKTQDVRTLDAIKRALHDRQKGDRSSSHTNRNLESHKVDGNGKIVEVNVESESTYVDTKDVRMGACFALGTLAITLEDQNQKDDIVKALQQSSSEDPQSSVREMAAQALSWIAAGQAPPMM